MGKKATLEQMNGAWLKGYQQDHYAPGCMQRRNRYMVDHSALVIAVYDGSAGGTRQTLEYAIRRGVPFLDLRTEEV